MPKIDPYSLPRPPKREETVAFKHRKYLGQEVKIRFRELDSVESSLALEAADNQASLWCGEDNEGNPKMFVYRDTAFQLSPRVITNACYIEQMQAGADPSEKYEFIELVGLAKFMSEIWVQIVMESIRFLPGSSEPEDEEAPEAEARQVLGNSEGGSTTDSSTP